MHLYLEQSFAFYHRMTEQYKHLWSHHYNQDKLQGEKLNEIANERSTNLWSGF
jgi:hypothetical protein